MQRFAVFAVVLSLLALGPSNAFGAAGELLRTFQKPTPVADDLFGWSVAAFGDDVLVGADDDDTGAKDAGAVYLFDGATGDLLQSFLNPTPALADSFGRSIAAVGDKVLVGAPKDDTDIQDAGIAYLFDATTGNLLQTFHNPTPGVTDWFGWSVAAVGENHIVIGAPNDRTVDPERPSGAAYLFDATTGELIETYLNPTPVYGDEFGRSVAGLGDKVLIGAPRDDTGAEDSGAAYLIHATTGILLHTFLNPTPAASDNFGQSLAALGDKLLIAAPDDKTGALNAGAVYLFDVTTGSLEQSLFHPLPATNDSFGTSIAAVGDDVLVGVPGVDASGGVAYLFDGATATLLETFLNPTPAPTDGFGFAVAGVGDNILIGARNDDTGAMDAGAAYLFEGVPAHTWNTSAAIESWAVAANWLQVGTPASDWYAILVNQSHPYDQTAVVTADSTVDRIILRGVSNTMTVHIPNGVSLTAGSELQVSLQGIARVDGSLTTDVLTVDAGGGIRAELSIPGVNHINANGDATIAAGATLAIDEGVTPPTGAQLFHVIQADANGVDGGILSGTFDTVNLPTDDALGRRYSVLYENSAADGVGVVDTVKIGLARPGDGNFDSAVDSLDLLAASPFYDTTTPANWREGNWRDTGGSQGVVDALDLLDASPFFDQTYGSGELALGGDVTTPGQTSDGNPSIIYDFTTGEVLIDTDGNTTNTYVLDSLAGIFTGAPAIFIGGTLFTTDNDFRIAENFHTSLAGVHNLGSVAQPFLTQAFLLADLTLQGGTTGNPNFEFDLVLRNTPEPSTVVLIGLGLLGLVGVAHWRHLLVLRFFVTGDP